MKCNVDKINDFFNSDKFEADIKKFVSKLLNFCCKNDININKSKLYFLDLGFYEIEKEDDIDIEDDYIIDFYKLSNFNSEFRATIFKLILTSDTLEDDDFFIDFMYDDLKIFIPYKKWEKINRKNKLKSFK